MYGRNLNAYRKTSVSAELSVADPYVITKMLYQGLFERLARAKGAIERNDLAMKGKLLGSATAILENLRSTYETGYISYLQKESTRLADEGNTEAALDILNTGKDLVKDTDSVDKMIQSVEEKQQELGEILPKMRKLKQLIIEGEGDVEWTSIEFLKNQKSIEELGLFNCKATNYSVLKTCKSLKEIEIISSELSKAEDLIGLENVESIMILNTPLAENPEEIKKLQEAYPDADIYY